MNELINYDVTDASISVLTGKYKGLVVSSNESRGIVSEAISVMRNLRVGVESKRKELKSGALEYGRKVDSEARRIAGLLSEIEDPLKASKKQWDNAKALIKKEKEDAEKNRVDGILEKVNSIIEVKFRVGTSIPGIEAAIKRFQDTEITKEIFMEFFQQALDAKDSAIRDCQGLLEKAVEMETERVRLEVMREEQEEAARLETAIMEAERVKQEEAAEIERLKLQAERLKLLVEREKLNTEIEELACERRKKKLMADAKKRKKEIEAAKPDMEKVKSYAIEGISSLRNNAPKVGPGRAWKVLSVFLTAMDEAEYTTSKAYDAHIEL